LTVLCIYHIVRNICSGKSAFFLMLYKSLVKFRRLKVVC
jgi:hypothetical protein